MKTCILCIGLILIMLFEPNSSRSCTVFYIFSNGKALGGSNEDWKDPNTYFSVFPASEGNHGWIRFSFGSGFPQAGMNDAGLFWDATSNPFRDMPVGEAEKIFFDGPLMQEVMENCLDLPGVIELFSQYYCEDMYRGQYLIGGADGCSVIIDGDNIHGNDHSYQVLTNFRIAEPDLGGFPCQRYETAVNMLEDCDSINEYMVGSILAATHQEGEYPSQYSLIFDPQEKRIIVFYKYNFKEYLCIDLESELKADTGQYALPALFSSLEPLSPDGMQVFSDTAVIQWLGLASSSYELQVFDDSGLCFFRSGVSLEANHMMTSASPAGACLSFLLLALIIFIRKREGYVLFLAILLFLNCCKKDDSCTMVDVRKQYSEVVTGLKTGENYSWKVIASASEASAFHTESPLRSFRVSY